MARYDRIAPLAVPVRDRVFAGWPVFRDLDGKRDIDLGRRTKLRFMAYRPLRRLLDHGIADIPAASFEKQLHTVQEELGILSPRDAERIQLGAYLKLLRQRTPESTVEAALLAGALAEQRGHNHAAGEFYGAALEAALQHSLAGERIRVQIRLARFADATGGAGADAALQDALERSGSLPDEALRIEVLECAAYMDPGARAAARDEMAALAARGSSMEVRAGAAAALARLEISAGNIAQALEVCWHSFIALTDTDQLFAAGRTLAAALSRMGQRAAADLCLQRAEADAHASEQLLRLQIDAACNAGHAGESELFYERRADLLDRLEDARIESVFFAEAHLDLAAAALDCQSPDFARDHLRHAIEVARQSQRVRALDRAEALLSRLEEPDIAPTRPIPDERGAARRIAAALVALSTPVPAAGS